MKVLGLGDNVIDRYTHTGIGYPGGNALNFSVYARMLSAEAAYLGVFGDDRAAEHIRRVLERRGIGLEHCLTVSGEILPLNKGSACFSAPMRAVSVKALLCVSCWIISRGWAIST